MSGRSQGTAGGVTMPRSLGVIDLVVRRDWYGLAARYRAGEVTLHDATKVCRLLERVPLEDIVVLEAQLQLAEIRQVQAFARVDLQAGNTRARQAIAIASGMALPLRQRYLRHYAKRISALEALYRQSIYDDLVGTADYRYENSAPSMHAVQSLVQRFAEPSFTFEDERARALRQIAAHDAQLLEQLFVDARVSLRELQVVTATLHPLDALRLAEVVPRLLSARKKQAYAQRLDIGALAQARYELASWRDASTIDDYMGAQVQRLQDSMDGSAGECLAQLQRLAGLCGTNHVYARVRQALLRRYVDSLDSTRIAAIRRAVVASGGALRAIWSLPVIDELSAVDALTVVAMLGERFDWCQAPAIAAMGRYADESLTQAQQIALLDDRLATLDICDERAMARMHSELYRLSMRQAVTAVDIALYAPAVRNVIELLHRRVRDLAKGEARQDVVSLAYLVPASQNKVLRVELFRAIDESVYARLLNESIAGSSLAVGFFRALTIDDALYLVLRWGNVSRNGYLVTLLARVNKKLSLQLVNELKSRDLSAMASADVEDVLDVLAAKKYHAGASPEQAIVFIDKLIHTYSKATARQIVGRLGLYRTDELERVSPFYMRLLIDAIERSDDDNYITSIVRLGAEKYDMTYDGAQRFRADYHREVGRSASDAVIAMLRARGSKHRTELLQMAYSS